MLKHVVRPKFMIIGAQKSGTSSLFSYLDNHPYLLGSKTKETNFFFFDSLFLRGDIVYDSYFDSKFFWQKGISFEGSVGYLYYPFVAERLAKYNPNLRFIVLLRNPTERAYSAWNMFRTFIESTDKSKWYFKEKIMNGYFHHLNDDIKIDALKYLSNVVSPDFFTVIRDEVDVITKKGIVFTEPGIVSRGIYHIQIENMYKYFDKKNFYFQTFDNFSHNTRQVLDEIQDFLKIPKIDSQKLIKGKELIADYSNPLHEEDRNFLDNFYEPYNLKLNQLLGRVIF
jgi:hypothetical protein